MAGPTIPFSQVANVIPGVLTAGGIAIDLNGVMLTQNPLVPYGAPLLFSNNAGIISYLGATSTEAGLGAIYFNGFTNCTKLPGALYMTNYPENAIAAWLRSGSLAAVSLTTLQTYSGSLTIVMDGYTRTAASVNLSGATSFSNAASLIQTAINASLPSQAVVTGSITTTTLTVSAVTSGTLAAGQTISGTNVTAGTQILAQLTGTAGGVGTYTVSVSQSVTSTTITATATALSVSFNSTANAFIFTSGVVGAASTSAYATGTIAAPLLLTQATSAVLSQGAAAATPATFMANLVTQIQNWATFGTVWESTLTEKEAFAAWSNSVAPRYLYVPQDSDINVGTVANSTEPFGYYLSSNQYAGTCPVYGTASHAFFIMGCAASLDFTRLNGRATLDFKSQSGLTPYVTNATTAGIVATNGPYNFYGAFGGNNPANNQNWMTPGSVSGVWLWWDTYCSQIWLNANLQLAMVNLFTSVPSIPYNASGYGLVYAACLGPINAAINFGAIRKGVVLSAAQVAEIQYLLGFDASAAIMANGFYLQIVPATAPTRAARQSPSISLLYQDGESIQQLTLASIVIQ
jgi:hypothetical protein